MAYVDRAGVEAAERRLSGKRYCARPRGRCNGLPKRVRGKEDPLRRELEAAIAFPHLLDLLEKFDDDKLAGSELGDIERYHRLRNALYHDGNGVTVDPDKVDVYNQIAHLLFQNLFEAVVVPESEGSGSNSSR
jgi:hypothetical protein